MNKFMTVVDNISEQSGRLCCYLILVPLILLAYDTIARYAFNAPTIWAHEIAGLFAACFFIVGGAYNLLHKSHINMDAVYGRWRPRTQAIVNVFTSTLFFLFVGTLFYEGIFFAYSSIKVLENTGNPLYAPLYPVKVVLCLSALLMLLQGTVMLIRDVNTVIRGSRLEC